MKESLDNEVNSLAEERALVQARVCVRVRALRARAGPWARECIGTCAEELVDVHEAIALTAVIRTRG